MVEIVLVVVGTFEPVGSRDVLEGRGIRVRLPLPQRVINHNLSEIWAISL